MSFESDKSDNYFTQGVRCRAFNRAIRLFPAEKTEGIVFLLFLLLTLCMQQCKIFIPP